MGAESGLRKDLADDNAVGDLKTIILVNKHTNFARSFGVVGIGLEAELRPLATLAVHSGAQHA